MSQQQIRIGSAIESRTYVIITLCMIGNISDVELDPLVSDLQSVGITSTSQATLKTVGVTSTSQATLKTVGVTSTSHTS